MELRNNICWVTKTKGRVFYFIIFYFAHNNWKKWRNETEKAEFECEKIWRACKSQLNERQRHASAELGGTIPDMRRYNLIEPKILQNDNLKLRNEILRRWMTLKMPMRLPRCQVQTNPCPRGKRTKAERKYWTKIFRVYNDVEELRSSSWNDYSLGTADRSLAKERAADNFKTRSKSRKLESNVSRWTSRIIRLSNLSPRMCGYSNRQMTVWN